jgi:hypothetical protein
MAEPPMENGAQGRRFFPHGKPPAHWTMFSLIACGSGESDTCRRNAEAGGL